MVDLVQALMQQRNPQAGVIGQNALNRQAQMANMLLQGGQATTNPLVAALSGFMGARQLGNIADEQARLDEAEMRREREIESLKLQKLQQDVGQLRAKKDFLLSQGYSEDEAERLAPVVSESAVTNRLFPKGPETVVNIGAGQDEFIKKKRERQGTIAADFEAAIFDAGDSARELAPTITRLGQQLKNTDTGPTVGARALLNNIAQDFGITEQLPETASAEEIESFSNKIVIPQVKKLGVNPTDRDFAIALSTVPNLGTSNKANAAMLELMAQANERAILRENILQALPVDATRRDINKALREAEKENPFQPIYDKLPESKDKLKNGARYFRGNDLFIWDGDKFVERTY